MLWLSSTKDYNKGANHGCLGYQTAFHHIGMVKQESDMQIYLCCVAEAL